MSAFAWLFWLQTWPLILGTRPRKGCLKALRAPQALARAAEYAGARRTRHRHGAMPWVWPSEFRHRLVGQNPKPHWLVHRIVTSCGATDTDTVTKPFQQMGEGVEVGHGPPFGEVTNSASGGKPRPARTPSDFAAPVLVDCGGGLPAAVLPPGPVMNFLVDFVIQRPDHILQIAEAPYGGQNACSSAVRTAKWSQVCIRQGTHSFGL